jgi:predicted flap endonuclease-1-like 5' DNA nuclease
MMVLIGQMLGCLIVAAGIGGAIGWLLRPLSTGQLTQASMDITATLRHKEQMLAKVQHELKVQAAAMQTLESKIIESDELNQSMKQELSARNDRLHALQEELAVRTQRLTALEGEVVSLRRSASEYAEAAAVQSEEIQQLHLARQEAQQALESNEQERHNLQRRVTELESAVAETDHLRERVGELEPAQGRVHWLEVQLCDREAEHRAALHQLKAQLDERDRRIGELEPLFQRLQEQEAALTQWETKYAQTLTQHEAQIAMLQQQLAGQDRLQAQLLLDKQLLHERAEQIDGLQHRIHDLEAQQQGLADQVKTAGDKQAEVDRLRKRLVEVRAALRIKTDGGAVAPRQKIRQNGSQLSLQIEQVNAAKARPKDKPKDKPKDDLSKIHGIGPTFARTLNKMGLHSFDQIARWTPEDIDKVAKKLYTAPDRIKRDKWVDEAKKLHEQKYGQRL